MTGVQRIVDDVRAWLSAHDQTLNDRLRLLASDYAMACSQAEDRLRRCEELTRDGYYGEALYLAELDPPLITVMSILSTLTPPEREEWGERVGGHYSLPVPAPLSLARASELNRSYAEYAVVEPKVRKLRHLSRARAPLAERAAVLRELYATDRNCPLWADQLDALEAELRAEMLRSLEADLRTGNRSRMDEYYSALAAPGWRKPATPAMIAKAAVGCLPRVIAQMKLAVSRDDLAAARQTRSEWDRIARDAMLLPNDPISERATTILDQIERMERRVDRDRERQNALETFNELVYRKAAAEELSTGYNRAREVGAKIPKALKDEYDRLLSKDERGRDVRQSVLGIVAIIFGAMVLITFLVLVIRH